MALAMPPIGVSNAELVRWTFEVLNTREVEPLRRIWTRATIERFPSTIATNFVVFDQMQFARQIGLLAPDGSRADRATKAAFNAKTRLLARLRARRAQ